MSDDETSDNNQLLNKRIILKISGEALAGPQEFGIDFAVIHYLAEEIASIIKYGVEIGIVVGGGNFFRGANLNDTGLNRVTGDHMGMLATVINAIAMRDVFEKYDFKCEVMSAVSIGGLTENYSKRLANQYLKNKHVVIFAGGTGNPLVTTDFALTLRGIELQADLLLKATNVDGIYTSDPKKDSNAQIYNHLTYDEAIDKKLAVMDLVAFCQCRDYKMQLRVFNLRKHGALLNIIQGKDEGTLVA